VIKVDADIYERSHTQANHCGIFAVKENCSIDHVKEQCEVRKAPWEVTWHVLKQGHDELLNKGNIVRKGRVQKTYESLE
jgi:hypothetical protein